MTDIEKKALALLNEVWAERGRNVTLDRFSRDNFTISEALCRAIERHEAFRQEVSEALLWHCKYTDGVLEGLQHLIIADPEPEPDALRDLAEELARESQDLNLPLRKRVDWFVAQLRARGVTAPARGEG